MFEDGLCHENGEMVLQIWNLIIKNIELNIDLWREVRMLVICTDKLTLFHHSFLFLSRDLFTFRAWIEKNIGNNYIDLMKFSWQTFG